MFRRNPAWLEGVLEDLEANSFDEVLLRGDGFCLGTKRQVTTVLKENFLFGESFTRDLQEFSLSRSLRLDPRSPFAGGTLREGVYRWQCVIPPAVKESVFVLRKHRFETLSLEDFSYGKGAKKSLFSLLERGIPFLVVGATGSGKTSFLQAILGEFFKDKRLLILEEYEELSLKSPLWVRLLACKEGIEQKEPLSLGLLFKEALRLRPDHFVLGELRAEELKVFLEAAQSGHKSTSATFHGGSLDEVRRRLFLILGELELSLEGFSLGLLALSFSPGRRPHVEKIEELIFP